MTARARPHICRADRRVIETMIERLYEIRNYNSQSRRCSLDVAIEQLELFSREAADS